MTTDVTDGASLDNEGQADLAVADEDRLRELTELTPLIFRVAMSLMRNRTAAEDVVQETLVKAWSNLDKFRGEAPFKVWVLRIANNTAISMLRRRRDQPTDPATLAEAAAETAGASPARRAEGRVMLDDVWAALDRLDPLSRTIVVLREVEGMIYEDIAAALDVALPTVKTRLFRARRELAVQLEAWR